MTEGKGFTLSPLVHGRHEVQIARPRASTVPTTVYAFADHRFDGNPAAVVMFDRYPEDGECLYMAQQLHQPVTAFLRSMQEANHFELRWFTQNAELDLCGHGTFAATHWLFSRGYAQSRQLTFHTRKGPLRAWRADGTIRVELPAIKTEPASPSEYKDVGRCMGIPVKEIRRAYDDYLVVAEDENAVVDYEPDFSVIAQLECRGVILTASTEADGPLHGFDIVSRFFAPRIAIDEDQVCVSAHCKLQPYWAGVFGRADLRAFQASKSGGALELSSSGERVIVGGTARLAVEPFNDIGVPVVAQRECRARM